MDVPEPSLTSGTESATPGFPGRLGKVVVAGGSGFIGTALTRALLADGRQVVVLSRTGKAPEGARGVAWGRGTSEEWKAELEGAEAVVNLAGRPIACRWTPANRHEIVTSRVEATETVGMAVTQCDRPPRVWVNASAVGVYGDRGDEELDERSDTSRATGFLAEVGGAWERAVDAVETPGTRKVKLRIGFVIARDGGALPVMARLARLYLGGAAGSGRAYVSWIDIDDLIDIVRWLMHADLVGAVNATAPRPVPNSELAAELRSALHRPWSPPVPAPILRVVGKLVGPDAALLLEGQRVLPSRALGADYEFRYPDLRNALRHVFSQP